MFELIVDKMELICPVVKKIAELSHKSSVLKY